MEKADEPGNECVDDIESIAIGDVTIDEPAVPSETTGSKDQLPATPADDVTDLEAGQEDPKTDDEKRQNEALDDIIFKALEKVKEYFFQNEIEENRLAEFMFKILTLNSKDINPEEFKLSPELLDQLVEQMLQNREVITNSDRFNDVIDNLFGPEASKAIVEKLCTEKIDEIVEKLLGEDTKKMICEKLESENLDELMNKLVDEKLKQDDDPEAKHPNFDDFIEKILGKETEEFIRQKLEVFLKENAVSEEQN